MQLYTHTHTHTHTGVLDNNKNNEICEGDIYKNASNYDAKIKLKNGLSRTLLLQMAEYNLGITLIALIITIIVLLIFAGVTLNLTIGSNGIFSKADSAKTKTTTKSCEEELKLSLIEYKTQNYDKEINIKGYKEWVEKEKNNLLYGHFVNINLDDENSPTIATVQYEGFEYTINSDFIVTFNKKLNNEEINRNISIDKEKEMVIAGNKTTLTAIVTPEDSNIEWLTENENIATVENGIITGVAEGTTNIHAKISGTDVLASCEVTVKKSVAKIGDTYYESVTNAVSSVPRNGNETTIELFTDSSEGDITIANGQNIVFNGTSNTLRARITNNGTLKIVSGTIIGWSYPLTNYGIMTITGGTIETESYNVIVNNATLNISGGYFKQIYNADIVLWHKSGTSNISGGVFETGEQFAIIASAGNVNFSGSNTRLISSRSGEPVGSGGGTISGAVIKNMSSSGCDVYAYTNNSSITKLQFPTWTDYNGQDDIIWIQGTKNTGNIWYCRVNASEHNNEIWGYHIHIYQTIGGQMSIWSTLYFNLQ